MVSRLALRECECQNWILDHLFSCDPIGIERIERDVERNLFCPTYPQAMAEPFVYFSYI